MHLFLIIAMDPRVSLNWIPTTYNQNICINLHINMIIPNDIFLNPVTNGWCCAEVGMSNHHGWHQAHLMKQATMVRGKDLWKKACTCIQMFIEENALRFFTTLHSWMMMGTMSNIIQMEIFCFGTVKVLLPAGESILSW